MSDSDSRFRKVIALIEKSGDSDCMNCGQRWGQHYGLDCPVENGGKYLHISEVSISKNPNIAFKRMKVRKIYG